MRVWMHLAAVGLALATQQPHLAVGQTEPPALTGHVGSFDQANMEGVLVSARKRGTSITITVVSDKEGRFSFPASKIQPGEYALAIRAVGYELDNPTRIEVSGESPSAVRLTLRKTADLASQLSNGEWLVSMPGTDAEKSQLLNCVGCHTLERIARSTYDKTALLTQIMPRMQGYVNQSIPSHPQLRRAERLMEERDDQRVEVYRAAADFLSTINQSSGPWSYTFETHPRPSERATRVIYTEYDLPRQTISPHDVIVDADGIVWFSSFGEQNLGRLDPRTGKVAEYPIAEHKPGFPTGGLGLRADRNGDLWLGNMYQATVVKFDRKTETFTFWPLPADQNIDAAQVNMVSAQSSHVDGKVWAQNNGFAAVHRLDVSTGRFETWRPFRDGPRGVFHNVYDVIPDSKNNVYFTDFRQRHIGRIDATTGELKLFQVPTPGCAPRRGTMDPQDRLWFGEYRGNRIGMFDTKTEHFKEWTLSTPWSAPYDVVLDKNEQAWTGSMVTDQVTRLDTRSGEMIDYLLPRSTNIRRVFVDNSTTPVSVWVGSNHGASIVKLEPLD